MRQLILLRHAKSSWVNPKLDDFDRPLNKRGQRGAKALGGWFRSSGWQPDQVLCSAARRTRETWEGLKLPGEAELRQDLYHATAADMLGVLRGASGKTVLMIGHNPGIAALAQELVATAPSHPRISDFPTGSLLLLDFDIEQWSRVGPHTGTTREFLTPHDLVEKDS